MFESVCVALCLVFFFFASVCIGLVCLLCVRLSPVPLLTTVSSLCLFGCLIVCACVCASPVSIFLFLCSELCLWEFYGAAGSFVEINFDFINLEERWDYVRLCLCLCVSVSVCLYLFRFMSVSVYVYVSVSVSVSMSLSLSLSLLLCLCLSVLIAFLFTPPPLCFVCMCRVQLYFSSSPTSGFDAAFSGNAVDVKYSSPTSYLAVMFDTDGSVVREVRFISVYAFSSSLRLCILLPFGA